MNNIKCCEEIVNIIGLLSVVSQLKMREIDGTEIELLKKLNDLLNLLCFKKP
jgi:hypothetical protein